MQDENQHLYPSTQPTTSFRAKVSGRWGRAIFLIILGLLGIAIFVIAGPTGWFEILRHPFNDLLGFTGVIVLIFSAIILPCTGINLLWQEIIIHNGQLILSSLFRKRKVSLTELVAINARIKTLRSLYGTQYRTYVDISDHAGEKISIPLHYYQREAELAKVLLDMANQKRLDLDANTQVTLREIAESEKSGSLKPMIESDRMMLRQLKQVSIGGAIILLLVIPFALYKNNHDNTKSAENFAATSQVAEDYISDLRSGNIVGARALESPKMQDDAQHAEYLRTTSFAGFKKSQPIDRFAGHNDKGDFVTYVYRYDDYQQPYYLRIALSKYDNEWRVWFFQTSYNVLHARQ